MKLVFTDQQEQAVKEGRPIEVIDPASDRAFVVLGRELYDRVRALLEMPPVCQAATAEANFKPTVPPGIRRSQEALRRDLPKLLEDRKLVRQWAAYHGADRIGIARTERELIRECLRRGLADDQYYVGWIDSTELIEEEELQPPPPGEMEEDEGSPAA